MQAKVLLIADFRFKNAVLLTAVTKGYKKWELKAPILF